MTLNLPVPTPVKRAAQTGMVLLLCLIFLTTLTLLGLTASADAILQNKLSANLQENERARQSALTALSWAESWLLGLDSTVPETCTEPCSGVKIHAQGTIPLHPEYETLSWWLQYGHETGVDPITGMGMGTGTGTATVTNDSINPPIWVIELLHTVPPAEDGSTNLQAWYRLLARGSGRSNTVVSVIESTIVRSWSSSEGTETTTRSSGLCPGVDPTTNCGRMAWRELR